MFPVREAQQNGTTFHAEVQERALRLLSGHSAHGEELPDQNGLSWVWASSTVEAG